MYIFKHIISILAFGDFFQGGGTQRGNPRFYCK